MELINLETGVKEAVDEKFIQDGFLSGKYGLEKGQELPVFDADGNPGYIPAEKAYDAFNDGFRFRTSEETKVLENQEKYGDSDLLAAGLGAARGLTFGVSDVIADQLGYGEDVKAIKDLNEEASLAGELASFVVPGLTQIKAIQGAATGIRAAQAAGRFAGAEAMSFITRGVSNKIVQKALKSGVESAVESAFFSTGKLISEAALGNIDFNAESIAPEVVKDVLLGGVFGAVGSAAGSIGGKAVNQALSKARESVIPGIGDKIAKAKDINIIKKGLSSAFDVSEENIDKYIQNSARIDAMENVDFDSIYRQTLGSVDDLQKAITDQHNLQYQILDESQAIFSLPSIKKDITDITGEIGGKDIFGISEKRGKAVSRLAKMRAALDEAGDVKAITALDMKSLVQSIDEDLKPYYERLRRPGGAEADATENALIKLRRKLSDRIKDRIPDYKDAVEIEAGYINDLKAFQKLVRNENTAINNIVNAVKNPKRKADREVLERFGNAVGVDFTQLIDDRLVYESFEKNATRGSKGVNMFAIPGAIAAGGPGAVAGAAAGAVRDAQGGKILRFALRQAKKMPELKSIEMAGKNLESSIKGGVKKLLSKDASRAVRSSAITQVVDDDIGRLNWADIKSGMIQLQTDVAGLLDLTTDKTAPITDVAPETAAKSQEAAIRAFQFLDSKMPKSINGPLGEDRDPPPGEIRKFKRYLNAVRNPASVIEKVGDGYIPTEGVEVLKNVYPSIYQRIQEELVDQIGERDKKEIPYGRLVKLSNAFAAFGQSPMSLARIQANFNAVNAEPTGQPIKVGDSAQVQSARRTMTQTDRIALGL